MEHVLTFTEPIGFSVFCFALFISEHEHYTIKIVQTVTLLWPHSMSSEVLRALVAYQHPYPHLQNSSNISLLQRSAVKII